MKRILSMILPSEEKIKRLSRPEKIRYLERWLTKARVAVCLPPLLFMFIILRAVEYFSHFVPLLTLLVCVGLFPLCFLVDCLSNSLLGRCVRLFAGEEWTGRTDIPLLLRILKGQFPVRPMGWWAREQLSRAAMLHCADLTVPERTEIIRVFRFCLGTVVQISPKSKYIRATSETITGIQWLVPMIEATAEVGGRAEISLLRSLKTQAAALRWPPELQEVIENSLSRLKIRLSCEEAPEFLLRAGQAPTDTMLRAASSPRTVASESLLRADNSQGRDA